MILEPVRVVSDWLKDATHGVNAQLAALASAGLIEAADGTPPDVKFIGNPVDDREVARWDEPVNKPAIYVTLDGPGMFDGEVPSGQRSGDRVSVAVRYITSHPDPEEAIQDAGYTLRAIVKSLKVLNENDHQGDRTRNGIHLKFCNGIQAGRWREAIGNGQVVCAAVATYELVDLNP